MTNRLLIGIALMALCAAAVAAAEGRWIETNRQWDRLTPPAEAGPRATLAEAARALGDRTLRLAGVEIDGVRLAMLAGTPRDEPLLRAVRENIGRAVDLTDFLLMLDDIVVAGEKGLLTRKLYLPSGRVRGAGVLLHPDDVFGEEPRRYGSRSLAVHRPKVPEELEPAADGAPLGPRWTARYRNPANREARLAALEVAGAGGFARRIRILLDQLEDQGAEVYVSSTVRSRERGYLIYGAFILSRAADKREVDQRVARLDRLNREWGLDVPIQWRHPEGWRATVQAAKAMAGAYNVVYATQKGARYSNHYGGNAADFAAMALPRRLTLRAPGGGERRTFDLSAPDQPRDLNLTPKLINWIEAHFEFNKLRSDYPHWTDAAPDR